MESNKNSERNYQNALKKKRKYSKKRKSHYKENWENKKLFRKHFYELYKEFKSIIHNLTCTQCNDSYNIIEWENKYPYYEKLWSKLLKLDLAYIEEFGLYSVFEKNVSNVSVLFSCIYYELTYIPGEFLFIDLQFSVYVKCILKEINPTNFWAILSVVRQARYYYFSICTGNFNNKENNIWNIDLNVVQV